MQTQPETKQKEQGRTSREAWIAGVRKHYPGDPKPGYVGPWEDTPDWERQAAGAVYRQVSEFVTVSAVPVGRHAQPTTSRPKTLGGL